MSMEAKRFIAMIKSGKLPAPEKHESKKHNELSRWGIDALKACFETIKLGEAAADEKIKSALKKQEQWPISQIFYDEHGLYAKCPVCSSYLRENDKYCSQCGQALDWRFQKW